MRRAFIVEERFALDNYYFHYGVWEVISRQPLDDGRWLIECKKT